MTIQEALGLYVGEDPQWLPHPWYHDEDLTHRLPEDFLDNKCSFCRSLYHTSASVSTPMPTVTHILAATSLTPTLLTWEVVLMPAITSSTLATTSSGEEDIDPNPYSNNGEA